MDNNIVLNFDAFIRSFSQNRDSSFVFLLGAGASISSGILSAYECIWEWKKRIYISNNTDKAKYFQDYRSDIVKDRIQEWLDKQGGYPKRDDPKEYSFYAERAFPIEEDRVKYFSSIVGDKNPYVGYKLLCSLCKENIIKSVWSTNFDGLIVRAAHQMLMTPIEVNLDNPDRIYRAGSRNELLYVALHGDYKYAKLKNTFKELDSQHDTFTNTLKNYFTDKNLIVCGYSGRDYSLMQALQNAFLEKGSGRLYWCGYGVDIPDIVQELINNIRNAGREAFYVPTDGFDKTMINLTSDFFKDDLEKKKELDTIFQTITEDDSITPFILNNHSADKYVKSNLYPIVLPKEVFQFEIEYSEKEKPWDIVKKLTRDKDIVAVPFNRKIFALSTLTVINEIFGNRIKDNIKREPISIKDIKSIGTFKELFLKAIFYGISKSRGLNTDYKTKIWNKTPLESVQGINVYDAIECAMVFVDNKNYALLSIKPTIYIESINEISKETRLFYCKKYLDKLRNKYYDDKIIYWESILFSGKQIVFDVPINSKSDFNFKIGFNRAFSSIKVVDQNFKKYPIRNFNEKSILWKGIQFLEPQLEFRNANTSAIFRDYHPMRGLINHKPYDFEANGILFSEDIKLGVVCPQSYSERFHSFLQGFNSIVPVNYNQDYIMEYIGFQKIYNIPIDIPNIGSDKWLDIPLLHSNAIELAQAICHRIDNMHESYYNAVAVIFIPHEWETYKKYNSQGESFDLHDYIKAYAAQRHITTQIIEESTLYDNLKISIYWWLSLAFYVKSMRTPWALSNLSQDTAYAGIGYSIKRNKHGSIDIVLGCSHIYNAKGEGLKYKLSKIKNAQFDKKKNPYLTYDEAFQLGVSIRELFVTSMNALPKRVVIHKRTPFKPEEINGLKDALAKAEIYDIDLIEISIENDVRYLAQKVSYGNLQTDDFAISRGTCILSSHNKALLWTHGIVPSVKNQNYKYYLGGLSIPAPLKITKHYGKGDIETIAMEILGFTKMNWNSFDLYTKLPATIDTSNTLARIGNLLSRYEGKTYDYRYFI